MKQRELAVVTVVRGGETDPRISVAAVGDLSFGDHPVRVGHGCRSKGQRNGYEFLTKEIADVLGDFDFLLGNLEGVISDIGMDSSNIESFEMRGAPGAISALARAGFDSLGVANNHAMQHGLGAFSGTVESLRSAGILVAGIEGESGPTIASTSVGELPINVLAISMRPEERFKGQTPYSLCLKGDEATNAVIRARASVSGALIVSVHWGLEFLKFPSAAQLALGRTFVDAGADVVFGHHSHTVQGVDVHNGRPIFHSLGNFLFDFWEEDLRLGVIGTVQLSRVGVVGYGVIPVWVNDDLRVEIAPAEMGAAVQAAAFDADLLWSTHSKGIDEADYRMLYLEQRRRFRLESYRFFLRNSLRMPPRFVAQSLFRTAARRLRGE